jgi:hypothetical protein
MLAAATARPMMVVGTRDYAQRVEPTTGLDVFVHDQVAGFAEMSRHRSLIP